MSQLLREAIFWIALVCSTVASLAILRSSIVAPRGHGIAWPRRFVEVGYAVLPALVLAGVLAVTWQRVHPEPAGSALAAPHAEHSHSR